MSYKIKSQREAESIKQAQMELRLAQMCIDFGNYITKKLKENGNLQTDIEITLEDVRNFTIDTRDRLSS